MAAAQVKYLNLRHLRRLLGPRNIRFSSSSGQEVQEVEEHARKTSYNWKMIGSIVVQRNVREILMVENHLSSNSVMSLYVAVPAVAYLTYRNFFSGEHEEFPTEFVGFPHLRIRNKPFPWGDGDKSLFHNPHANLGPDSEVAAEEETEVPIEERLPWISKFILWTMTDAAEVKKERDEYIRTSFHRSLCYIEARKRGTPPTIGTDFKSEIRSNPDITVDGY